MTVVHSDSTCILYKQFLKSNVGTFKFFVCFEFQHFVRFLF